MGDTSIHRRPRLLIVWMGFLCMLGAMAEAYPVRCVLSQIDVYLPTIRIYLNLLDEHGNPIHPLSEQDLSVILDGQDIPIKKLSRFKDTDEGIAYTLLIDISKTMSGPPFTQSISAAQGIIENITEKDRIAIITFGDEVSSLSDFTNDKDFLLTTLQNITPDHNNTHFYAAIDKAYELNKRQDPNLPRRRAILVISDGKDEGSGLTFDDLLGQNDILEIPIYSIGYTKIEEHYLDNLKRLSELSGGRYLATQDTEEFTHIYQEIFSDLQLHYVIYTEFPDGKIDGSTHQMIVIYHQDPYRIQAEKKIAFVYQEPTPTPTPTPVPTSVPETPSSDSLENSHNPSSVFSREHIWLYGILGTGILLLLLLLVLFFKKRRKSRHQDIQVIEKEDEEVSVENKLTDESIPLPETSQRTLLSQRNAERELPVVKLIVLKGKLSGQEYTFSVSEQGRTLGRDGADVVIDDKEISNVHCSLAWIKNHLMIQDEGSEHGTFLNGIPMSIRMIVEDGDTIDIGQCRIRLKIENLPS